MQSELFEERSKFDVIIYEGCWKAGLVLSFVGCGPVTVVMVGYSWLHGVCFNHVFLAEQHSYTPCAENVTIYCMLTNVL